MEGITLELVSQVGLLVGAPVAVGFLWQRMNKIIDKVIESKDASITNMALLNGLNGRVERLEKALNMQSLAQGRRPNEQS